MAVQLTTNWQNVASGQSYFTYSGYEFWLALYMDARYEVLSSTTARIHMRLYLEKAGDSGWSGTNKHYRVRVYPEDDTPADSGYNQDATTWPSGSYGYHLPGWDVYKDVSFGQTVPLTGFYLVDVSPSSQIEIWADVFAPVQYTAPAIPTATLLTSDGTPNKAYSQVSTTGWGQNCSREKYEIINSDKNAVLANDLTNDPGLMYWTIPASSTSTNACSVYTWYGRAVNNQILWTDSVAKYLATPSAPTLTITGGSGTSPATNIDATIAYRGGATSSTTADTAAMVGYQYGVSTSQATPSTLRTLSSTAKTVNLSLDKTNFTAGNNYYTYVRPINAYGGTSYAFSPLIYCPSAVYGNLSSRTATSVTISGGANNAGTIGASSGGTLSCYELKWGTSSDSLTNTIPAQTSNTFTITGLSPNQTIYYQITAWNIYGLSNVSNVSNATTLNRFAPQLGTITPDATPASGQSHPCVNVTIPIVHTGGLTIDELPITSITVEYKPANSGAWQTMRTDSVNLTAGDSYHFLGGFPSMGSLVEGDYLLRITATNGTDQTAQTITLYAPTTVTIDSLTLAPNELTQIRATGTATPNQSQTIDAWYFWDLAIPPSITEYGTALQGANVTIMTRKTLPFNTTFTGRLTCHNAFGLWRQSATRTTSTPPRFTFQTISGSTATNCNLSLTRGSQTKQISDVYYVHKNALGNIAVGDNLRGKTLKFITDELHSAEGDPVTYITLSNGSQIRTGDADAIFAGMNFGLYSDAYTITTSFYDGTMNGTGWQLTEYTFSDASDIFVTSINAPAAGLNSVPAFATTEVYEKAAWET